jgi:hypothetical protein
MIISKRTFTFALLSALALMLAAAVPAFSQKSDKDSFAGRAVLWEAVDIPSQDLFLGPGGRDMQPNLSRVTFVKEEKGGHSKKFKIKDADGNTWVAKVSDEAQSETAAVRLLAALGYKTEINYLVKRMTIPGHGTFNNVRLEARPEGVKRDDPWKWGHTPFEHTPEMQGLKIMMAFINNWDMKSANNVILRTDNELQYVISDLGVSFGKTGSNPLPLFWRIGRSRNKPADYAKAKFVKDVGRDKIKLLYNGKNRSRMNDLTLADARWIADLLVQLSDRQIRDAFRAANYSQGDINLLTRAVKSRIHQLDRAGDGQVAQYR